MTPSAGTRTIVSRAGLPKYGLCLLALMAPVQAQQLGHVDISGPPPPATHEEALPEGCKELPMILTHGFLNPDESRPKEITLEVTKLVSPQAVIGKEVVAEVQLKNSRKYAIRIPWSTDLTLPEQAPDPDRGWFEVGEFEVSLTDATGRSIALKSTSQPLLGAPFSTGSFLEIAPGQWVTLTIKFKLEDEYRIVSDLKQGAARLEVEWRQWVRTWNLNREKCQAVRGSLYYQHLYKEQSKPLTIELTKGPILNSRTDNTDSIRTNDQE